MILSLPRLHAPKPDRVVPLSLRKALAKRRACVVRRIGPGSAADNAQVLLARRRRAAVRGRLLVIGLKGVQAPLPVVTVHVVEAPGIRLLFTNRRVESFRIAPVP